jgi:hypothetical protein
MRERERENSETSAAHGVKRAPAKGRQPQHRLLDLEGTAGNAAVVRLLHRPDHPQHPNRTHSAPPAAVQRAVTVGGAKVSDPSLLIEEHDLAQHLLTATGQQVLDYLKHPSGAHADLQAKDTEDLVIQVERIAAMIDLVRSINATGILGRKSLVAQGVAHTGSNDRGNETSLAVNVLDARGAKSGDQIKNVVTNSLTAPSNGSFSVAMERPQDDDMVLEELAKVTGGSLSEQELADIRKAAGGDEQTMKLLVSAMQEEKRFGARSKTVEEHASLLQERTQNTAMAIINEPGPDVANLSPRAAAYESDVPSDRIPPGKGGFTSLVLPSWVEPYGPLLMTNWPEGVEMRFAGSKQVTAHYRAQDKDYPVTVEAPDYGSEIQKQLTQFELIATHILKATSL